MNDALGLAFVIGIALFGLASAVLVSIWLWRFLRGHGVGALPAALIVAIGSVFLFWGLWIVFDLGWIVAVVVRAVMRLGGPRAKTLSEGR